MADDRDARIAQLEAELAGLRDQQHADRAEINVLSARLQARDRALDEAHERETATADVLRVIASGRSELVAVLDEIAMVAGRLVGGLGGHLILWDGECLRTAVSWGLATAPVGEPHLVSERRIPTRAFLECRTITITDRSDPAIRAEYPDARYVSAHASVTVPLVRDGAALGVFEVGRERERPFTAREVALLETFAAQGVIAIENARLFSESEQHNRDLNEALEQQKTTAEVLRVIATSPTIAQPVLDTILQSAMSLSKSSLGLLRIREQDHLRNVATAGIAREALGNVRPLTARMTSVQAFHERRTIHIPDRSDPAVLTMFPDNTALLALASVAVPLLREGDAIGILEVGRDRTEPYSPREITLLESFADQAVIAIENARLFEELEQRNRDLNEALEQQTATAEVLRVIASSPTDVQRALDTMVTSAARLCDADAAVAAQMDGDDVLLIASTNPAVIGIRRRAAGTVGGRALDEARTVHIYGTRDEQLAQFPGSTAARSDFGAQIATPLLREGQPIGVLHMHRLEIRPFTDQQIALFEAFANQAVIAIENARLFSELEQRNRELSEALEQRTATAEILGLIASSPTDPSRVLEAIAQ